ncbi:MAG: MFS transporter [bacterium]|nr:MFS transporter [bacterium]
MIDGDKKTLPTNGTPRVLPSEADAPRHEVILYAFGNIETAIANQFLNVINLVMIVAMGISPLLVGLIMGLKTLWDGVTDPVMAYITDNTRSRWGRRRPYILVGGIAHTLFLLAVVVFFPRTTALKTNAQLEAQKQLSSTRTVIAASAPSATNAAPLALTNVAGALASATGTQAVSALALTNTSAPSTSALPPPHAARSKGAWRNIVEGVRAFRDPANAPQRTVVIYMLVAALIFTTLTTIMSVPYYALGIELSPSYHGRTQVVTYRAAVDKIAGLIAPWVAPFCFLTLFPTALDGLRWVAILLVLIGIPATTLMVVFIHERTQVTTRGASALRLGFFRSIWYTLSNSHFLRIFVLYQFIGFTSGLFAQMGTYLNIYWVMGSAKSGTAMGARVQLLAWALSFATLPLVNWACRRFQKHNALRCAIVWMSLGCLLKWWCMNPQHPEYQYLLPFFFSVGISSVSVVLSTMMADVTDVDELRTGTRREGMFGAVMALLNKTVGSLTPVLAGIILVAAGFDPQLPRQAPETILRLRILYSFVPAAFLLTALLVLRRYPLTAQRMAEIKAELAQRRAATCT